MRVISGKARGTTLRTPEGLRTRPTADRVKEAMFSIIQFDLPNAKVLDLFGGTGQLGIEAVSRGVYGAVVSAMSGMNNGGQNVNVYLDGKQIYASVKKAEAQRGVTLMGNQLEYSF